MRNTVRTALRWLLEPPNGDRAHHMAFGIGLALLVGALPPVVLQVVAERTLSSVPIDWQVAPRGHVGTAEIGAALPALPGVRAIDEIGYADVASLEARTTGGQRIGGPTVVVGLPDGYLADVPTGVRLLVARPGGVLLDEGTAARLHAGVGDAVDIGLPEGGILELRVDGIVGLPLPGSLSNFRGPGLDGPAALPTHNVVIVPAALWKENFSGKTASARTEFHVAFDRAGLSKSLKAAKAEMARRLHAFQTGAMGQAAVTDNVGAALGTAWKTIARGAIVLLLLGLAATTLPKGGFYRRAAGAGLGSIACHFLANAIDMPSAGPALPWSQISLLVAVAAIAAWVIGRSWRRHKTEGRADVRN